MIQPLHTSREVWILGWRDMETPVSFGTVYILPTLLYVLRRADRVVLSQEIVRELDQRRTELFLHRLFQNHGTPDELQVPADEDWNENFWRLIGREYRCQISLVARDDETNRASDPPVASSGVQVSVAGTRLEESPIVIAEGLVSGAQYFSSFEKKRALLVKALQLVPDFPAALVDLADLDLQEGRLEEAERGFLAATGLGTANPVEIRLRARAGHGRVLTAWQKGELAEAIDLGRESLQANPIDHFGIRFLLPLLLLLNQQIEVAGEFLDRYSAAYPQDLEDPGLHFAWGLVEFEGDDEKAARAQYLCGMLQNFYLAPMLLDVPEPPPDLWLYNDRGDLSYAQDFAESFGIIWEQRAGATRLLRETYQSNNSLFAQLIQIRQQLADLQDNRYEPRHRELWEALITREQKLVAECKASF
jgi:tetratricopeptide (TPR) repeat protein